MSFINMFYRHETSDKNRQLEIAIKNRKCDEVKILLSAGADINHTINRDLDTMLHHAPSAGLVYDILGYSANVYAKNLYNKTPLHTATENGRSAEVILALLAHGADINAKDSKGDTPLNLAVKRPEKKYEVIKELVMRGSVVTEKKYVDWTVGHRTPLDDAVLLNDMECIKILIKYYALVKLPPHAYDLDLSPYYRHEDFRVMRVFLKRCCEELTKMGMEIVNDQAGTPLLQVVRKRFVCRDSLGTDEKSMNAFAEKCLDIVKSIKYPIYNNVIMSKLKIKLDKKFLSSKLDTVQVYSNMERGKIALNSDSAKALARYLPKNDLFNCIIAYYVPSVIPPWEDNVCRAEELRRELYKRFCEPSTSSSSPSKHFKSN